MQSRSGLSVGWGSAWLRGLMWAALVSLILAACASDDELPPPEEAVPAGAGTDTRDVPDTGMTPSLHAAYILARQRDAGPDYAVVRDGDVFTADNPRQGFGLTFDDLGVEVQPDGAAWWLKLQVSGYGCKGAIQPVESDAPRVDDIQFNEVRQGHGPLQAWYLNGPLGLEQGFEVNDPPSGGQGPLRISVRVEGLAAALGQRGEVVLRDDAGDRAMQVDGLYVVDAEGTTLAGTLGVAAGELVIDVEADDAVYPLTIDPMWSQQAHLSIPGDNTGDRLGSTVSVDGNTAVVGLAPDDEASGDAGAVLVFVRTGNTWSQQQKLMAADADELDWFGFSVSISGDTVVVGAPFDEDGGFEAGAAYVFVRSGTTWSQQQKLTAFDADFNDNFGRSVAISNNTVVVGAPHDDDGGGNSGAAYVFVRSGTTWSQQQKLTASDASPDDDFGSSVGLSVDTVVVGAPGDDDGGSNSGSAYVYARTGTIWTEQQKLTASDAAPDDGFGGSVSLSVNTVVAGAQRDDDGGNDAGSAYVFARAGSSWSQQQKLTASDAAANHGFGLSVSISGDTVAVGASRTTEGGMLWAGAAYVFLRTGTTWSQQQKLNASDQGPFQVFGSSVSVSGNTTIVGTPGDDTTADSSGAAYLFERVGASWNEEQKVTEAFVPGEPNEISRLGESVSVSGNTAVVGSQRGGVGFSGAAYIFVRAGTTWSVQQKLTLSTPTSSDRFGTAASLDGDTVIIGASGDDDGFPNAGSAVVFVRSGTTWSQQQKLMAPDAAADDNFGWSVSLAGDTVVIGAVNDDDGGVDSGSAYVYVRSGTIWSLQQKLNASDAADDDQFGHSVSVTANTLAVSAPDNDDAGNNSGSAYIFVRTGTAWSQQQKLTASDAAVGDRFGSSVSAAGQTVVVGAINGDDVVSFSGSAYVFERSGTIWSEQQELTASDAGVLDDFGASVSLRGDTLVVGAPGNDDDGSNSGSAYVFQRDGLGTWSQQSKCTASNAQRGATFGASVAVDGDTALVGAPGAHTTNRFSGSAYAFLLEYDPNGTPCTVGATCTSGFCVDGVCCNNACGNGASNDCEACNVTGSVGVCGPVLSGTACGDATNSACTSPDTCNGSGVCLDNHAVVGAPCGNVANTACTAPDTCDGNGACLDNHAALGAPCGDQGESCAFDDTCDGSGACIDNGLQAPGAPGDPDCAPYLCDGSLVSCPTSCAQDTDCASGNYCDGNSLCVAVLTLGTVCTGDNQCASSNCVDGVCCDSSCGNADPGDCQACNVPGIEGTCSPTPANTACRPAAGPCDVAETCDGMAVACPADAFEADGTACDNGNGTCDAGVCTPDGGQGGSPGAGGSGVDGGGAGFGGGPGAGGAGAGEPGTDASADVDGGCSCRTVGSTPSPASDRNLVWLGLLGVAGLAWRRNAAAVQSPRRGSRNVWVKSMKARTLGGTIRVAEYTSDAHALWVTTSGIS